REQQLTVARDRLRNLADVLAKREAAGDAAGFDYLRAEREVLDIDADRLVAAADRATAQARVVGFFASVTDASTLVVEERVEGRPELPSQEALVERAYQTRGEL